MLSCNALIKIAIGLLVSSFCNIAVAVTNRVDLNINETFYVPKRFNNTGGLFISTNGSMVGNLPEAKFLIIGQDLDGNTKPVNFITGGTISGTPIIKVHAGSTFKSIHNIAAVSKEFRIESDSFATFNKHVLGSGDFINNGVVTLAANGAIGSDFNFFNNGNLHVAGNFIVPTKVTKIGKIHVIGATGAISGDLRDAQLQIGKDSFDAVDPNDFTVMGNVNNLASLDIFAGSSFNISANTSVEIKYPVNGTGALNNNGTLSLLAGAVIDPNLIVTNTADLNVKIPFATFNRFTNTGSIFLTAGGDLLGDVIGGTSLNIAATYVSSGLIANIQEINVYNGEFIAAKKVANCQQVNNFAVMHIKDAFASNTIINHAGAKLQLQSHNINSDIINYGNMLSSFTDVLGDITNHGHFEIHDALSATNVINANSLLLNGELLATTLNNYGSLVVKGTRNLANAAFASPGQQKFTIKNAQIFDSLTTNGVIDIANGSVTIASKFVGASQITYNWNILTGSTLQTNDATTIVIPASTLHRTWSSNLVNNSLQVAYSRASFTKFTTHGLELDIAQALEKIAIDSKTEDHLDLIHAVDSCVNDKEYAANIIKLKPNANGNANYISIHNAIFKKVETRIAAIKEAASALRGIAVGELTSAMASWGAAFGSVANQQAIDGNLGYRATAFGAIFGIDKQALNDDIYGAAVALSNSNINEAASIDSKTHLTGYHVLVYGTNFFYGDNFFEWLFTGIINQNKGAREVILGGNNLNVASSYHNYQGGVRINLGKNMDFHSWGLAQVNTLQYSFLHQPSYNENGSPAALHIADYNSNIVTLGSGLRVFCRPNFYSALVAKPALHAMVTYDAVNASKGIIANFIIGDSDFTISQNPSRVAVKLGADIGCEIKDHWQLQFSYDLEIRSRYTDNSAEIKLKYLF